MSEQVQERKGLNIRIRDRQTLVDAIQKLKDTHYDMEKYNTRTLQFNSWTKTRWMEPMKEVIDYLEKFIPKEEE
jgi:hypothetical protein